MHRFWRQRSWFLSKSTFIAYWILHSLMARLCSMRFENKPKLHSPIGRNKVRFACNHMGVIFFGIWIVVRSNWAVSLPPSPCHGKNGSANTRSSPFNTLNKVVSIYQVHQKRPQRALQDALRRPREKTSPSSIGWQRMPMWTLSLNQSTRGR